MSKLLKNYRTLIQRGDFTGLWYSAPKYMSFRFDSADDGITSCELHDYFENPGKYRLPDEDRFLLVFIESDLILDRDPYEFEPFDSTNEDINYVMGYFEKKDKEMILKYISEKDPSITRIQCAITNRDYSTEILDTIARIGVNRTYGNRGYDGVYPSTFTVPLCVGERLNYVYLRKIPAKNATIDNEEDDDTFCFLWRSVAKVEGF